MYNWTASGGIMKKWLKYPLGSLLQTVLPMLAHLL